MRGLSQLKNMYILLKPEVGFKEVSDCLQLYLKNITPII